MKTFSKQDVAERSKLLRSLFVGLTYTGKGSPEDVALTYLDALADISTDSLAKATEDFLKGRVVRRDIGFTPSTAELVVHSQKWEDVLHPAEKVVAIEDNSPEISEEERARMRPRIAALVEEISRKADVAFEEVMEERRQRIERGNRHFRGDFVHAPGASIPISRALAMREGLEVVVDDPEPAE
jgi:hypothetical protein